MSVLKEIMQLILLACMWRIPIILSFPFPSFLEKKVLAMEGKREEELQGLRSEKQEMQRLLSKQVDLVGHLEQRLGAALVNNTVLQRQQASLAETVKLLIGLVSQCNRK